MSLGGEIMEEFYEDHIIPSYKKLLGECKNLLLEIKEGHYPSLPEVRIEKTINKIKEKLGEK